LLKLDPTDIAEQLCQLEHAIYARIRPQECLSYIRTQNGKSVENLHAFCATHDKLASWVKTSILDNETLSRRSDTVDLWIKVADVRSSS
jgi:son of sevenless-like protein